MGLFTPIWMTEDVRKLDKAKKAVEKVKDEGKLVLIATTAPENEVRVAAVGQLRDERRMAEVAMTPLPKDTFYRYSGEKGAPAIAARGIRDEALLGKIALTSPVESAQRAAVERIESQTLLARIALESGNKYTADDAARKVRDPALAQKLAMSDRSCGVHCAHTLSDPEALKAVALSAPMPEARRAAVSHLQDADALIESLARETDRRIRQAASSQLSRRREEVPLTPGQRNELVRLLVQEKEGAEDTGLWVSLLDEPEDLRRVLREAARADFRADAFARLVGLADAQALPGLYREAAEQARKPRSNWAAQKAWIDAEERVTRRVFKEGSDNPDLLMAFVWDAAVGPNMASRCIHQLFHEKLDGHGGIDAMRDMSVKAYLDHIPEYEKQGVSDEKSCVLDLAPGLPAAAREKYGFRVWQDEWEDEDQFGRNTVTVTHVEWRGKHYQR